MRILWIAPLLAMMLAGCTQGDSAEEPFEASCPNWAESPGQPGAQVNSLYYTDANGTRAFHLEGDNVHHPPTGKYELYGGTLDVFEFTISAGTQDGRYILTPYSTPLGTNAANHTDADRGARLYFKDMSRPQGQQILNQLVIEPGEDGALQNKTFRIELREPSETPAPASLWIDWVFEHDLDNDDETPSAGFMKTNISFWYRRC